MALVNDSLKGRSLLHEHETEGGLEKFGQVRTGHVGEIRESLRNAISTFVKFECRDRFLFAMLIDRGSILVFPVPTSSRGIEHDKRNSRRNTAANDLILPHL